jgi:hypothetical protein
MRIIRPPRISLRFASRDEALSAGEAVNTVMRALNEHADLYISTLPTLHHTDEYSQLEASFAVATPINNKHPMRMLLAPTTDAVIMEPETSQEAEVSEIRAPANTHIMLDLETMGTKPGCQVLSIGAVQFSPAGLGSDFYIVLDTSSQREAGLVVDESTAAWWERQSPEARRVFSDPSRVSLQGGLQAFGSWALGVAPARKLRMWGDGSDFDNVVLAAAYGAAKESMPWEWWNNRCYRTLKNMRKDIELESRVGTYHNALDDAKTQATHAIRILNELNAWATT